MMQITLLSDEALDRAIASADHIPLGLSDQAYEAASQHRQGLWAEKARRERAVETDAQAARRLRVEAEAANARSVRHYERATEFFQRAAIREEQGVTHLAAEYRAVQAAEEAEAAKAEAESHKLLMAAVDHEVRAEFRAALVQIIDPRQLQMAGGL